MRIVCERRALRAGLLAVKPAIKETSNLPVLSHVLLQAHGGRVRLAANSLEIAIIREIAAEALEEGAVVVPWQRLQHLAAHLPPVPGGKGGDQAVAMEGLPDASTLAVRSGQSRATIVGMHASEFPALPAEGQSVEEANVCFSLDAALFAALVRKVAFAAATDEEWIAQRALPVLGGMLVLVSGQSLTLTARDASRLAACAIRLQEKPAREGAVVIPAWSATAFARLLACERPGVPVRLVLDQKRAQVSCHLPGLVLQAHLLAGDYPMGFRAYFERGYQARVVVGRQEMASALRTVARVASADGDLVALRYERGAGGGAGIVRVGAQAQELGEQAEEIDVLSLEGAGCQMLLKLPQLAGAVAAIDAPHLSLEVCAPDEPVVVRPVGDESGANQVNVLVPCFRHE